MSSSIKRLVLAIVKIIDNLSEALSMMPSNQGTLLKLSSSSSDETVEKMRMGQCLNRLSINIIRVNNQPTILSF